MIIFNKNILHLILSAIYLIITKLIYIYKFIFILLLYFYVFGIICLRARKVYIFGPLTHELNLRMYTFIVTIL